ncbi:uncharacterized protein ATC70_012849 [Mucor velutinosus]|uniref:Uncharacterized protein n=3 Tax=Mucor velutinosus TaxID=708070 RepID=A0AAN7D7H0_9FUNG|nr:hypothetical protein ATC70_012849 [Mucor velutinosus]
MTFLSSKLFLGPFKPRKQHHQAVKIQTKPTTNTVTTSQSGLSSQPTPTVTSNSRLTLAKQTTTDNRTSKLPVASRKRRHSTIKATTVPLRRSPRSQAPTTDFMDTMNIATPVAPAPTTAPTSSTINMVVEPSTNAINPPAFLEGMHPPKPDEIHQSPLMPTWIQEIYSRLASVTTHLQTHDSQLEQNQALIKQTQELIKKNQELQLALDKAHHEIAQLKSAANQTSTPPSATTPVLERSSEGTSASLWADMAAKPPADEAAPAVTKRKDSKPKASTSTKPAPKAKAKRPLTLEQVSRFYSLPSTTHGYQFLYFTSRGREAISKVRAGFQVLGLSQSRILDIHYPTNNIISFLVHNDYASTVVEAMAQLPDSQRITDFDPCAPTILRDPKYANHADPLFLQSEAARIHQERLLRMIKRLNTPNIKLAVARDFCFKRKWISETMYQTFYREIYPAKASKTASSSSTDDVNMDDAPASQDSTSQPAASSSSISPADGVSAPLV